MSSIILTLLFFPLALHIVLSIFSFQISKYFIRGKFRKVYYEEIDK